VPTLDSRAVSFIAVMAAMGNVLSFLSIQLSPIMPSVPLGPVSVSLAIDLSHISTFIAAIAGGPIIGGLVGAVGGFVAAFEFGFSQGNLITGIGLPLGKAMTGVAAGFLLSRAKNGSTRTIAATIVSYTPEAIFTVVLFVGLFPLYFGMPQAVAISIAVPILVKAYLEMMLMGILLSMFASNNSFKMLLENQLKNIKN